MSALPRVQPPASLGDRLHNARLVTVDLMAEIVAQTRRRAPAHATVHLHRLLQSGAWTDAALELIALELPQWQLRRIAYDEGEWHCALSRQRELPDWLDQSIEARHADLALALLGAFVEAQAATAPARPTSVPGAGRTAQPFFEPLLSDNFG